MGHVHVRGIGGAGKKHLVIESIHATLRAGHPRTAVARLEHRLGGVVDLVLIAQTRRLQPDGSPIRVLAARYGVGTRISVEQIVETPILLHDVHHVRNLSGAGSVRRKSGSRLERSARKAARASHKRLARGWRQARTVAGSRFVRNTR